MPVLYDPGDFSGYFSNCIVRNPSNPKELLRVLDCGGMLVSCARAQDKRQNNIFTIPLKSFEWEHLSIPKLGYVSYSSSKVTGPLFLKRLVRRDSKKGYCAQTVILEEPLILRKLLDLNALPYLRNGVDMYTTAVVEAAFSKPEKTRVSEAVELISTKKKVLGVPLNLDFAVILGITEEDSFVLLWRELPIASSKDGIVWKFQSPEYESLAHRSLIF